MVNIKLIVCVAIIFTFYYTEISEASVCEPNSDFKLDCNTCRCSSNGKEFSCTNIICPLLIYKDKYLVEQDERGYSILKPKDVSDDRKKLNDGNFFIEDNASNVKVRKIKRNVYPYIQDEISEIDDNHIFDVEDDIRKKYINKSKMDENHSDEDNRVENNFLK